MAGRLGQGHCKEHHLRARYEQISRTHIVPMLGGVKLKGLSPTHVRGLYKDKLSSLSPRTLQCIHVTLHKVLKQAVSDDLILCNATEAVKPPQERREEIRPLTTEQVKMLLDAASLETVSKLSTYSPLTPGSGRVSCSGSKWDDLEAGALQGGPGQDRNGFGYRPRRWSVLWPS